MIRRPPRSTLDRSSAASDVYKRQMMDSSWPLLLLKVAPVKVEQSKAKVSDLQEMAINSIRTVSYTHLRAHETVLDLVCRLLLEKKTQKDKKKKKQQQKNNKKKKSNIDQRQDSNNSKTTTRSTNTGSEETM